MVVMVFDLSAMGDRGEVTGGLGVSHEDTTDYTGFPTFMEHVGLSTSCPGGNTDIFAW